VRKSFVKTQPNYIYVAIFLSRIFSWLKKFEFQINAKNWLPRLKIEFFECVFLTLTTIPMCKLDLCAFAWNTHLWHCKISHLNADISIVCCICTLTFYSVTSHNLLNCLTNSDDNLTHNFFPRLKIRFKLYKHMCDCVTLHFLRKFVLKMIHLMIMIVLLEN
jgi:hypothetical protein